MQHMSSNIPSVLPAPKLVVMLTCDDFTVDNAEVLFEKSSGSLASYWGFKEAPLPRGRMRDLFGRMKECGKHTCLEVVAYSEDEGLAGARLAAYCGCDVLMGTSFFPSIAECCRDNGIRYMPFVGTISGRPSVLTGTPVEMIDQALRAIDAGAWGIDLLGYRCKGDAVGLNKAVVAGVPAPVCIAGSIDSYRRIDEVAAAGAWGFTIGSAFFNHCFGDSFAGQIDAVCRYLRGGGRHGCEGC